MPLPFAKKVIDLWSVNGLKNVRFSGGEPTLHPHLRELVAYSKSKGVDRIAVSTNGYSSLALYKELVALGVNDFSISLDACCSATFGRGIREPWEKVSQGFVQKIVENIQELSKLTYVTLGMVFTEETVDHVADVVNFGHSLGVADIRIISAAQYNKLLVGLSKIPQLVLDAHPILKYRVTNFRRGGNVRGITENDFHQCALVLDDSAVAGCYHFPCIIYLREGGEPIGKVGPKMREERGEWFKAHDSFKDAICRKNCLDVCVDYNNRYRRFHRV
jgi:MoaA/NifB/PqqE/SkfB family radical SAM enzyme